MSNMAYCVFQNTLVDLSQAYDKLADYTCDSTEEAEARKKLIALCCEIASDFGDEVEA